MNETRPQSIPALLYSNRSLPRLLAALTTLAVIALVSTFGPPERSLGSSVRIVYLHGAWVWASLGGFLAAALTGAAGLVLLCFNRQTGLLRWSRALGRTGLLFWITYLPISIWAMQANWNGLFLAEPRWRLAVAFAAGGLLLQAGVSLMEALPWAGVGNLLYFLVLFFTLVNTPNVMHPPAPILHSDAGRIQLFFGLLVALTLLLAFQIATWWRASDSPPDAA